MVSHARFIGASIMIAVTPQYVENLSENVTSISNKRSLPPQDIAQMLRRRTVYPDGEVAVPLVPATTSVPVDDDPYGSAKHDHLVGQIADWLKMFVADGDAVEL